MLLLTRRGFVLGVSSLLAIGQTARAGQLTTLGVGRATDGAPTIQTYSLWTGFDCISVTEDADRILSINGISLTEETAS